MNEKEEEKEPEVAASGGPRFKQRCTPLKALEYDFLAARTRLQSPNTVCESAAHLIKAILSAGVYAMHVGFTRTGVLSAGITMLVMSACSALSMWSLVDSAQKMYGRIHVPVLSYPDLAEAAMLLSPWRCTKKYARCFRYLVELTMTCYLQACCGILHIFISRNVKQLIEGSPYKDSSEVHGTTVKPYILGLMLPLHLGAMLTNLKNLAPFTVTNLVYIVAVTITVTYYGAKEHINYEKIIWSRSIGGWFEYMGICVYSLEGITVALGIENNMEEPKKFPYVVLSSYLIVTAVLLIVGFFGFFGFRKNSIAPVTIHFPWSRVPMQIQVFLIIFMYITYIQVFYFGFDVQWYYLKRLHATSHHLWFWERVYRTINVVMISFTMYWLRHGSRYIAFIGSISVSLLVFIYPAIIKLMVDWPYPGSGRFYWRALSVSAAIFIGSTIFFVGTYFNSLGSSW